MKNLQPSESYKFSQNNFQRWAFGRKFSYKKNSSNSTSCASQNV